jgi:hypothetical protein
VTLAKEGSPLTRNDALELRELAIDRLREVALQPGEHATLSLHRGSDGSFSAQVDVPDPTSRRKRICLTVQLRR